MYGSRSFLPNEYQSAEISFLKEGWAVTLLILNQRLAVTSRSFAVQMKSAELLIRASVMFFWIETLK